MSNASRTLLYDLDRRAWSDELLGVFGVPRETLPEVVACHYISGAGTFERALDGVQVLEPASGRLTGADTGPGRLPEPAELLVAPETALTGYWRKS